MLDVGVLLDASLESVVDELELADHVVGALAQADLDVESQLLGLFSFAARSRDVLLRELDPGNWIRHPIARKQASKTHTHTHTNTHTHTCKINDC